MIYEQVEISTHRKAKKKKRSQKEIIELNNKMTEIKNSLNGFIDRFGQAEKRISELKEKRIEIIQSEEEKKK